VLLQSLSGEKKKEMSLKGGIAPRRAKGKETDSGKATRTGEGRGCASSLECEKGESDKGGRDLREKGEGC